MNNLQNPQEPGKIVGYKTHEQAKIDLVNKIKNTENQVGELVEEVKKYIDNEDVDLDQWFEGSDLVDRGARDLQIGFMEVVRSLFRPESKLKP